MENIKKIAERLGIKREELNLYGDYVAKVSLSILDRLKKIRGKYVLVTSMTPTPFGEGKTTITIGLSMALNKLGKKSICCIREPSLGPIFGIKGGATGGGRSSVIPEEEINFHFTGDSYAITVAHNLCSSFIYFLLQ